LKFKDGWFTGTLGAGAITGTSFIIGANTLDTEFAWLDGIASYVYRDGGTDVAVADGGTGLSSWTLNGLLYASATGTLANSAVFTFNGTTVTNILPAANNQGFYIDGATNDCTANSGWGLQLSRHFAAASSSTSQNRCYGIDMSMTNSHIVSGDMNMVEPTINNYGFKSYMTVTGAHSFSNADVAGESNWAGYFNIARSGTQTIGQSHTVNNYGIVGDVSNTVGWNSAGNLLTIRDIGGYFTMNSTSHTLTAGTLTVDNCGFFVNVAGGATGTSFNCGIAGIAYSADTNFFLYNGDPGVQGGGTYSSDVLIAKDDARTGGVFGRVFWGTGAGTATPGDAYIAYNGTNWLFVPDYVGTGKIIISTAQAIALTLGKGSAGVDYQLTFDGETSDGVLTWTHDLDYFRFEDDVLLPANERLFFEDTSTYFDNNSGDLDLYIAAQKTLELQTAVVDDLQFQVSNAKVTPNNLLPSWEVFTTNTSEYAFSVDDEVDTQANELPHWWKQGTAGNAHLHITTKGVPAQEQKAQFTVTFAYADTNEVWVEAPLTAELTIPISTTALTNFYLDLGDLTLTNYLIGAQIRCRIKRVAKTAGGTEYAGDIFITQCGIHLSKDTMGSRQELIK